MFRLYKNPGEVLLGFDIDSCSIGFDGKDVYAEERFRRSLCKGYNLVNKSRRSTTYEVSFYYNIKIHFYYIFHFFNNLKLKNQKL